MQEEETDLVKTAEIVVHEVLKRNLRTTVDVSVSGGKVKVVTNLLWAPEGVEPTVIHTGESTTSLLDEGRYSRSAMGFGR